MTTSIVSNPSFVQTERHLTKSDRFTAIQPAQFATVLADHGFDMVGLKAGRARNPDRAEYQTTIARYRARNAFEVAGLSLDIMIKAPHLYGAVEFRLGFFRGTCANQWNMGSLFATHKILHTADYLERANVVIPAILEQSSLLTAQVCAFQGRQMTAGDVVQLAQTVARLRLEGVENVGQVHAADLVRVRRAADAGSDLFSVANVLQENVTRYGFRYDQVHTGEDGREVTRHMTTRRINESGNTAVEINASIWDEAAKLLG